MTQQTNRDVLYSLKNEPPSKSLNDDAAAEIQRLQNQNERLTRAIKGAAHLVTILGENRPREFLMTERTGLPPWNRSVLALSDEEVQAIRVAPFISADEARRRCREAAEEIERLAALVQSNAEPAAWRPDADMRAELDRSELVARALLKEIMKQIDYIESEGHIEWHKRITVHGELYLPDLSSAALAALYTAPPRPDASAGLIEAAEMAEQCANGSFSKNEAMYLRGFADRLRARAADRFTNRE